MRGIIQGAALKSARGLRPLATILFSKPECGDLWSLPGPGRVRISVRAA